jgi:wyosine [tRNA(Phe)-imidazoG37] synthetase (radical SAM superfamily)
MSVIATTTEPRIESFGLLPERRPPRSPFGYARDFLGQRFVYLAISPRARGLSVGINLNPDKRCTFNCIYCEVDRSLPGLELNIDCDVAQRELEQTLALVNGGKILERAPYNSLPRDLLTLRHVALIGDGEPTVCPNFLEVVETVVHVRARGLHPFFKIVLITNASHLDTPQVQAGLSLFTIKDEIWAKLDAGTQADLDRINESSVPLPKILDNIQLTARKRPVIIQSLFSLVDGQVPTADQISEYVDRLNELKQGGANIPLVQIYSATRPVHSQRIQHLPLRTMRQIADTVRNVAGLRAEVS